MAKSYSITTIDDVTAIRLSSNTNLRDILQIIDEVAGSELSNLRLWDLTEGINFSCEEIRTIAEHARDKFPLRSRVAYLAPKDVVFGLSRMFQTLNEIVHADGREEVENRVFREEPEALAWLKETD